MFTLEWEYDFAIAAIESPLTSMIATPHATPTNRWRARRED